MTEKEESGTDKENYPERGEGGSSFTAVFSPSFLWARRILALRRVGMSPPPPTPTPFLLPNFLNCQRGQTTAVLADIPKNFLQASGEAITHKPSFFISSSSLPPPANLVVT